MDNPLKRIFNVNPTDGDDTLTQVPVKNLPPTTMPITPANNPQLFSGNGTTASGNNPSVRRLALASRIAVIEEKAASRFEAFRGIFFKKMP